jgi:hypothetical protein
LNTAAFALTGGSPSGGTYSGTGVSSGTFNPGTAGAGTHLIIYTYTDTNTCTSLDTAILQIDTVPVVALGSFAPICAGAPAFLLTGGLPAGGIYTGSGVSGATFDPASAGGGIHAIRYIYSDLNNCKDSIDSNILVHAQPQVQLPALASVCENDSAFALIGGIPIGGTYSGDGVVGTLFHPKLAGLDTHLITYTFADTNSCTDSAHSIVIVHRIPLAYAAPLSGFCTGSRGDVLPNGFPAGGSYTGLGISGDTLYPALTGTGSFPIYYHYTDSNNCSVVDTSTFTVHAQPVISIPSIAPMCLNDSLLILQSGVPAGGVYTILGDTVLQFDPVVHGTGNSVLKYTATDTNRCTDSGFVTITVYPLPSITLDSLAHRCLTDSILILNSGKPIGGTYSGTGVIDSIFYVGIAGSGAHRITYSYTDGNGCADSAAMQLSVTNPPEVKVADNLKPICLNEEAVTLEYAVPRGGIYEGSGVIGGNLYPYLLGEGKQSILYRFVDSVGCSAEKIVQLSIVPVEIPDIIAPSRICTGDTVHLKIQNDFFSISWDGVVETGEKTVYPEQMEYGYNVYSLRSVDRNGCIYDTLVMWESKNCGDDFELFPNPNNGKFSVLIRTSEIAEVEVSIINILGQRIMVEAHALHPGLNRFVIQFIPEYSGTYLARVRWGDRSETVKFVVH